MAKAAEKAKDGSDASPDTEGMAVATVRSDPPPSVAEDSPPEELLTPLEGEDGPCGPSLRYDPVYDRIKEARRADPDLPQGVWERELKRAEWPTVRDLCIETLSTRTKDLQLAFWLTEAWTHLEGFRGFRRGIDLICSLCEDFWDDIHPEIGEDGDLDYRMGPIQWANDHFSRQLALVPITEPEGEERPYTLHSWHEVLRIENLRERDRAAADREAKNKPSRGVFEASVSLTPVEYYIDLVTVVEAAIGEVDRLDDILERQAGNEAPSIAKIRGVLTELDERARRYLSDKGGELPTEAEPEAEEETASEEASDTAAGDAAEETTMAEAKTEQSGSGHTGPIDSRAEAYRRLSEAADYLMRTEPHSPVPYLIRRAVVWGNKSFGELLVELMENGGDHQRVLRLLGLNEMGRPDDGSGKK